MPRKLFLFLAFGCVGFATEIFFTAAFDNIVSFREGKGIDWNLIGKSYVWMFPIYGLAGILFPLLFHKIELVPLIFRLLIYAIGFLTVEFIAGFLLDKLTGHCPWYYTTGLHFMHYIRLDYFPLWASFGYIVERIYIYLNFIHVKAHS